MRIRAGGSTGLDARLSALEEAVAAADGRLDPELVGRGRHLLSRAGARLGLGIELTVVALAGATGSGKSSLFNALSGVDLASVGVRRPTTARPQACVWGPTEADPLLNWLAVGERHRLGHTHDRFDGMVLLDLPDHDSTELSHRLEVDRLVELVDLLVWVLDPQKYADAILHRRYLTPLRGHSDIMLIVLNRIDELDAADRRRCLVDLERIVHADGLGKIGIIATSCRTGEGLEKLRDELRARVAARQAAVDRLTADAVALADDLAATCEPGRRDGRGSAGRGQVVDALAAAAGVDLVARSVERSHRRDAALRLGWPFTRWLRKLRPDPLGRLHVGRNLHDRTSLPAPTPVQRARIETAVRRLVDVRAGRLPEPWPDVVQRRAAGALPELPRTLDRVVATTEIARQPPRWWALGGALQWLLAAAVVAGLAWLTALFVLSWLRLPEPPTPEWEGFAYPTLMVLGGCLAGLVVAWVAGLGARVGGARRAARARRRLRARLEQVADEDILEPVEREIENYERFCSAVARARDR